MTIRGLLLDDGCSKFDKMKAQGIELGMSPPGALWAGCPEGPPDPIGAAMQHEAHLIGQGLGAGGAIRGEMRLPGLDMVLGLPTGGIVPFRRDACRARRPGLSRCSGYHAPAN